MAEQIADLFINDGIMIGFSLGSESSVFLNYPWELTTTNKLNLVIGNNTFWMKEIPDDIAVNDIPVQVSIEPELSLEKFHTLLGAKFDYIIGHMKILKVVGSKDAVETSKRILNYFTEQERNLRKELSAEECPEDVTQLRNRVKRTIYFKQHRSLTLILARIANVDNVSQLNSGQRADYLRQVDSSRTSRSLAKRAAKEGLDFDETARREVMEMAKHFDEIKDIDDTNHSISFFSQDTTFGGIKLLVEVSRDENFESFEVDEILQLLNLVGVACSGPIGDFPDPMTWKVDEIFLGCYVSVSDILVAFNQSNGHNLKVPAIDKEMTNVIPIFDDHRIGRFLKKYAPSLLEYTHSIGMRRVIAVVPMTIGYTMGSGVLKMISEIDQNKSSLHLSVFQELITSFTSFVGKYFDHILPFLKDQDNGNYSFYIGYNGISNMLSPLLRIFKDNDQEKLKLIPSILRALYTHEVWQVVRKAYKGKNNKDDIIKRMLYRLLGIDIERHKTPLKGLFEGDFDIRDIKFHDEPNFNEDYLTELSESLYHVNYLTLIPKYFEAVMNKRLESIKDVPEMTSSTILETLQVDYPFNLFLLFNVIQALLYTTRTDRENSSEEKMKIPDLKNKDEAMNEVKDYIRDQYKLQYLSELPDKRKREEGLVGEKLALKIFEAETYEAMIDAWRNGISGADTFYSIQTPLSSGYTSLCNMLSTARDTSKVSNIFKVLMLGVDNDKQTVWGGISAVFKKQKAAAGPTRGFWAPGPQLMFLKK